MASLVVGGWPELFTKRERYSAVLLMFIDSVDRPRRLFAKV